MASSGFTSGQRVLVATWDTSPIGSFTIVVWTASDGHRHLFAPRELVAALVRAVHDFDEVTVRSAEREITPRHVRVSIGARSVEMHAGRRRPVLPRRPRWFTRRLEAPLARGLLGVDVYGESQTGVRQWYQASSLRWVRYASGTQDGRPLGGVAPLDPPLGLHGPEPPKRPSLVLLRGVLFDPSGSLDKVVSEANDTGSEHQ